MAGLADEAGLGRGLVRSRLVALNTGAEDTVDRHLELFEVSFGGVVPGGVLRGQSGIDFGGDLFEMHTGEGSGIGGHGSAAAADGDERGQACQCGGPARAKQHA